MRTDDFNLVDQPWILVRMVGGEGKEVSLREIFEQAHQIKGLAGELPTQNAALLRLLLAVLYTVFSRVDPEGMEAPLENTGDDGEDDVLDRWQALWEAGRFPVAPIRNYLESVRGRFWLFDEAHPFFQFPAARQIAGRDKTSGNLKCKAAKINGEVNESDNKIRIFSGRNGAERESMSYAEAARWLVHLVAYDDCAVKKSDAYKQREKAAKEKDTVSPGVGWAGKLGLVYAEGDNLFETLMLNLVLEPNGIWDAPARQNPLWEWEDVRVRERERVACPDNMAELLTFPSRCVLLERENGRVIGDYPLYGMFFDEGAPLEQMTMRNGTRKKNNSPYAPWKPNQNVFLWREFESLLAVGTDGDDRRPGVVRWINKLQDYEYRLIDRDKLVRFCSVGVSYGASSCSFKEITSDTLDLHAGLVSKLGMGGRQMIVEEVRFTQNVAQLVGRLAKDLCMAGSGSRGKEERVKNAAEQGESSFYEQMDLPFRRWLRSISVTDTDLEAKRSEWRELVRNEAQKLGRELAERAGPAAFIGHMIHEKRDDPGRFYSTAKAWADFNWNLNYLK